VEKDSLVTSIRGNCHGARARLFFLVKRKGFEFGKRVGERVMFKK